MEIIKGFVYNMMYIIRNDKHFKKIMMLGGAVDITVATLILSTLH